MQKEPDGLPLVADLMKGLGVRRDYDISPDEAGMVGPGTGGMSVTPNDPDKLPRDFLPRALGGKSPYSLWLILDVELGEKLSYRPDDKDPLRHGFVEPALMMAFEEYRVAIQDSRPRWKEVTSLE